MSALGNSLDKTSYANIDEVESEHLALHISVDFERSVFEGSIVHSLRVVSPAPVGVVYFDSVGIDISKVELLEPKSEWY